MTDCCVCLEFAVKYTSDVSESKCPHPVCADCYKQLDAKLCPLCRVPIKSLRLDIESAIYNITNFENVCILDYGEKVDEIIFDDYTDEIYFINYEMEHFKPLSKRMEIKQYYYQHLPKHKKIKTVFKYKY